MGKRLALMVVVIAPLSVFSSGTSVLTTTWVFTVPTSSGALSVVGPTGMVTEDRTSVDKSIFRKSDFIVAGNDGIRVVDPGRIGGVVWRDSGVNVDDLYGRLRNSRPGCVGHCAADVAGVCRLTKRSRETTCRNTPANNANLLISYHPPKNWRRCI